MIVRDEAHIIREALDSAVSHIDYWVIVDTGSRDDTCDAIRAYLGARGIPGELHERPWRDFGSNRTEALELCAGKADYVWVLDADDLVVGDFDLSALVDDSYLLRYGPGFGYWRKQIFRLGLHWKYVGVVHEYPACDDPCTEERLLGDYHLESRRLGARGRAPDTYARDAELLVGVLQRDPDDERAAFYLGQSLFDAGDPRGALEWYSRRARMGGWEEEVFCSLLRRAECLVALEAPWEQVLDAYLESWQTRPTRAEPLYEIARHYRIAEKFQLGYLFAARACAIPRPENDLLFVAEDVYAWRAPDELAVCAYHVDRREQSFALCQTLLENPALPEPERERVRGNRDLCAAPAVDARRLRGDNALSIAIYTGPAWELWSPADIEHRSLGGSETAAVRLAEALAADGHAVEVFADVLPCEHELVNFRPYSEFDPRVRRDAVIVSRRPEILHEEIAAAVTLLWMHDVDHGDLLTADLAARVDGVMGLSMWHREHLLAKYPFLDGKLTVTRNGITSRYFTEAIGDEVRDPRRVIYSSSPDRGLDFILDIWPEVLLRCPDATLEYCYAGVYDRIADEVETHAALLQKIEELGRQPTVTKRGSMTQPQLAAAMKASGVWLAPSWSTPASARFYETFCIGAVEAAAAGLVRVMSDWGALRERDEGESVLIPSSGPTPDRTRWIDGIVEALDLAADAPPAPSEQALSMSWAQVAADFTGAIHGYAASGSARLPARPGDRRAAPLLVSLAPSTAIGEIALDVSPPWPCCAAAIAGNGDEYRMIVRTVADDRQATIDYLVVLDGALDVLDVRPLIGPASGGIRYHELRLSCVGDAWLATATVSADGGTKPVVLRLEEDRIAEVIGLDAALLPAPPWAPFVDQGELAFAGGWWPNAVSESQGEDSGLQTHQPHGSPATAAPIGGASSGVEIDGGWLFAVPGPRTAAGRTHRFVLLGKLGGRAAASAPFRLTAAGDEQVAGLAGHGSSLVISFGMDGRSAALATVDLAEIDRLLGPYPATART